MWLRFSDIIDHRNRRLHSNKENAGAGDMNQQISGSPLCALEAFNWHLCFLWVCLTDLYRIRFSQAVRQYIWQRGKRDIF